MSVERTAASSVYLGILAFLSHRRLFNNNNNNNKNNNNNNKNNNSNKF